MADSFVITQEEMDAWIATALRLLEQEDDNVSSQTQTQTTKELSCGSNIMPKQLHTKSQGCGLEENVNDEYKDGVDISQCQDSLSKMEIMQLKSDSANREHHTNRSQKCSYLHSQKINEYLELQRRNRQTSRKKLEDLCDNISARVLVCILLPRVDKVGMQLKKLFFEKMRNEISMSEFFQHLRNIVGEEMLRLAIYVLEMEQIAQLLHQREESRLQMSEDINHAADRMNDLEKQKRGPTLQETSTQQILEANALHIMFISRLDCALDTEKSVQLQLLCSERMEMNTHVFRSHVRNTVGYEMFIEAADSVQMQKNKQLEQQAKENTCQFSPEDALKLFGLEITHFGIQEMICQLLIKQQYLRLQRKKNRQILIPEPEDCNNQLVFGLLFILLRPQLSEEKAVQLHTLFCAKIEIGNYEFLLRTRNIVGDQMLYQKIETLKKQLQLQQTSKGIPYQFSRRVVRHFGQDLTIFEKESRMRESGNQHVYHNLQSDQQIPTADPINHNKQIMKELETMRIKLDSPNQEQQIDHSQKCSHLQLQEKNEYLELQSNQQKLNEALEDIFDEISLGVLVRILLPSLDKDRAMHLMQFFSEEMKNKINLHESIGRISIIVDVRMLKEAIYMLQMLQIEEQLQRHEERWLWISSEINYLAEMDRMHDLEKWEQDPTLDNTNIRQMIHYVKLISRLHCHLDIDRAVQLQMLCSKGIEMDTYVFKRHVRNIVGDKMLKLFGRGITHFRRPSMRCQAEKQKRKNQHIPAEERNNQLLFGQSLQLLLPELSEDRVVQLKTLYSKFEKKELAKYEVLLRMRYIVGDKMLNQAIEIQQIQLEQPSQGYPYQLSRDVVRHRGQDITSFERKDRLHQPENRQKYPNLQKRRDQWKPAAGPRDRDKQIIVGMLLPLLLRHLEKDRENQVQALCSRLKENDIHGEEFLKIMKNIVGVEMLRGALYKLKDLGWTHVL